MSTVPNPCSIHGYRVVVLQTIAGSFRGYRCETCGHVTDVDPRKTTHHLVYEVQEPRGS